MLNRPAVGGADTKFFRPTGVKLGLGVEANRGFNISVRREASTSPTVYPPLALTRAMKERGSVILIHLLLLYRI